ncbi:hypothetical protein ACFQ4N_11585 [Oceanobacillus iheyensis]|uniref:hypothetical protein n=1 Tax=Oceanobacillus iheyensis TaxID=182710 RepID=UPI00363F9A4D
MIFSNLLKTEIKKQSKIILPGALLSFLIFSLSAIFVVDFWILFPIILLPTMWLNPLTKPFIYVELPKEKADEVWIKLSDKISHVFLARFIGVVLNFLLLISLTIVLIYLFTVIDPDSSKAILSETGISASFFWLNVFLFALMFIMTSAVMLTAGAYGAIKGWGPIRRKIYFLVVILLIETFLVLFSPTNFVVLIIQLIAIIVYVFIIILLLRNKTQ